MCLWQVLQQGPSGPPSAKASAPPPVQGTPVTLASLSAQLGSLRAMTRDPEVKICVASDSAEECFLRKPKDALGFPADETMKFLKDQMHDLRLMVRDFEVKTCKEGGNMPSAPTALLDSGATHAVISFRDNLQDLEKVPVTLAGDERQEWLRTPGGTLVVPPDPTASSSRTGQTILPLGALVESLGCQVTWTRRRGLKVVHPTLGTLRTRISDNTCPYVEEDQALRLIAELEDKRLARFKERVQNLECHLESYEAPLDPTESLRRFINSGDRLDALKAFLVQPYLLELPDHVRADLAETIPCATPGADKAVLKLLPLKRAARRSLLESPRWAVHLCSGSHCGSEPLSNWARERGLAFLQVDLRQPGGKGWDLSRQGGIWKVLLWAAVQGRVAAVLSSPPSGTTSEIARLEAQGMILWSLASVSREEGIPYVAEHGSLSEYAQSAFRRWSGTTAVKLNQGSLGDSYLRPTVLTTNLDLGFLSTLRPQGVDAIPPGGRAWTHSLRAMLARALSGSPPSPSCEHLDQVIAKGLSRRQNPTPLRTPPPPGQQSSIVANAGTSQGVWEGSLDEKTEALLRAFEAEGVLDSDEEGDLGPEGDLDPETLLPVPPSLEPSKPRQEDGEGKPTGPKLSSADVERWRRHLANGHLPYRRDCKQCVEGSGLGVYHRRVRYPKSFTLSVDLFGPVPVGEAGRDESCVTGKNLLRYGLVGAFRVPKSLVQPSTSVDSVKDLFAPEPPPPPDFEGELAEYEPSEPPNDLSPAQDPDDPLSLFPSPDQIDGVAEVGAVTGDSSLDRSVLEEVELPQDKEAMQRLIDDLRSPVDQVVLRYFIPLRSKTGPEVTEALQQMILGINQRFPVRTLHHDPGTEFASTALSRWLAQHGVRVQHSLPTDKKGNGLSERTVGWVKSRIRTLLNSADLPVKWWPLAARWAVWKHNAAILGEPDPPSFGQKVLHRVKRPADGAKQLMERWTEARYAAPHRSIPEGHVLLTPADNLVASRGFRSEFLDPTRVEDLQPPALQEEEGPELEEGLFDDAGKPLKRLRDKTSVRFLECQDSLTSEEVSRDFLISQDYGTDAIRKVLCAVAQEEESTGDRRGIVEGRQIFGAYCHGGLRGVTNLSKRKPWTTKFLNRALSAALSPNPKLPRPTWSALMLMRAGSVEVHRDWRNEHGTANYAMHVPSEVQLWVDPNPGTITKGTKMPVPTWCPHETITLTGVPCAFDPRRHHAVRMFPDWLLVAYTPLGTSKTDPHGSPLP